MKKAYIQGVQEYCEFSKKFNAVDTMLHTRTYKVKLYLLSGVGRGGGRRYNCFSCLTTSLPKEDQENFFVLSMMV